MISVVVGNFGESLNNQVIYFYARAAMCHTSEQKSPEANSNGQQ